MRCDNSYRRWECFQREKIGQRKQSISDTKKLEIFLLVSLAKAPNLRLGNKHFLFLIPRNGREVTLLVASSSNNGQ